MKAQTSLRLLTLTALVSASITATADTAPVPLVQQAFPGVPVSWFQGRQTKEYSPITLDAARTLGNPNAIEVTFSAPVAPASATNTANYTVAPGVSVTAARLGTNAFTVVLTTTAIPDAGLHTLAATNIFDATLQYSIPPTVLPLLKAQGVVTRKLFSGIGGSAVSDLTNAAKFPNSPDAVDWPAAFEASANAADNYGLQFAGYVHPPATGDYAFFIAADDTAALYLSPDANPANKALLATVPATTAARTYTTYTNQRSAYVRLEAGRAYYVEALLKESTGSDHLAVTWRLRGMSAPTAGDAPIPGAFLSSLTPSAPVSLTAPPQPQTVAERAPAAFATVPTGTPPYTYQWLRNGAPIPGATATNYTIASAPYSLSGSTFAVVVANAFSSVTSSPALLTVTADTTPPTIVRLDGSATLDRVTVSFSEPVTTASANNSANYAFTGGLTVLDATLQPSGTNVLLLTSPQTPGAAYTLTATGVADTAALHNTAPTSGSFTAWAFSRGFARREVFLNLGTANSLSALTGSPKFPDSPDQVSFLAQLEAPVNVSDAYGERLLGLLLPPLTGFYVLYVASDDEGALYLSTDDNPANKTLIASGPDANVPAPREWNRYPSQRSAPVWLVAGQSYYLEAQMKEGVGGDHLAVAWQLPGGSAPTNGAAPIPGTYLATYANPAGTSLVITQQPASVTVLESNPTNFTVGVTASYTPAFYQWQKNGVDIPGTNAATYTTPRLFRTDDGARFRCFVSIPGTNLLSAEAVVTVVPDTNAPQIVSAATLAGSASIGVCFNELLDPVTATNPSSYTLSTGGQVTGAILREDGKSVSLAVSTMVFTNFTLNAGGVKDMAGNSTSSGVTVQVLPMETTDLGVPGTNPAETSSTFACNATDLDLVAGGDWQAYEVYHLDYRLMDGDFDVETRIARLDTKSIDTFAGLVARESLASNSRFFFAYLHPPGGYNQYWALYRGTVGGTVDSPSGVVGYQGAPIPNAWIRFRRIGDSFTALRSTNGIAWTQYAQMNLPLPAKLLVGVVASSHNNAPGLTTTAWFRNYSAAGTAHPPIPLDLLLKKAADPVASYSLDGTYQTTPHGTQNLWQTATSNAPAAFNVQVQNDSTNTLSPVVKATETAETGWTVTYRVAGQDITAQIRSTNGYTVTNLIAGTPETITVEFLPGSRVIGGTPKSATLSVFTDRYTTSLRDTVRATAIFDSNHQPDLMVRRLTDVIYRGKGIFNADGTGQTKSLELDYGMTGVYPIQLANAGNVTNFFNLRGTAGGAGWTVRYLDSVSAGADITSDMTGGGTIVALPPAASWEGRVEVTFDTTVPRGASNELLVTASAIGTAGPSVPSDTVRIITSVITETNIAQGGTYTTEADFEKGTLVGLSYGNDQLQLSSEISVLPFIWVPNSNEGTVSKVDTRTGREIGRYRTCPTGVNGQPSRTTIDQFGNCWVANRQSGTVVKIGLMENGQYLDRNGNGVVDTSQDTNGDGDITGSETLAWSQDECVLYEVILIPGKEGTYTPGTYAGGYVDNYWNPGPRGIAVDYAGNVWAGTHDTMKYYYLDGTSAAILRTNDTSAFGHTPYGAVIDANGILWSSGYREPGQNSVLRLDPKDNSMSAINFEFHTYGLGLDRSNHLFVSGHQESKLSRINVLTGAREWTVNAGYASRGVTCTDDGDVWVACSSEGTVWRFSNDGIYESKIAVGSTPTGVSVDAAGKVWVVNDGDENIVRVDPALGAYGAIDMTKRIIGGLHYGYSDMTGIISRSATTRFGTWTVRHNSKVEFTQWNALTWHGTNLVVTNIVGSVTNVFTNCTVRVRSSNDQQQWSGWERAESGYPLSATPAGQWLEIEVTLQQLSPEGSPVLYDIAVTPIPQGVADLEVSQSWSSAYAWWPLTNRITVINHGPDDASGLVLTSSLPAGLTFLSASSSQGSLVQSNGLLRWNLGSMADGASLQAEAVVVATNTGIFTNFVGVKAYDTDPQTNNNRASVMVAVMPTPCLTPPSGLSAWWPGEDSTVDLMGTNSGVITGGITYTNGRAGRAFQFNGSSYVRIPASPSTQVGTSSNGFTVEMWVKPDDMGSPRTLAEWYGNGSPWAVHFWLSGWSAGSGSIGAAIPEINGTYHYLVSSPGKVVAGTWQHVALTYDRTSGQATIYCNATNAVTSNLGRYSANTITDLYLGARTFETCCYFRGAMDEVSIYTRALTPTEVQAIYLAGSGGKCKGPVDVWLTIATTPSGVVLRWPYTAAGWQLQYVEALFPGVLWQNESTPPQLINSAYQLTLPATATQRFYRLKAP